MTTIVRVALWTGLYVLALGCVGVDVEYSDGLRIKYRNWWERQ